ncbi:MAG TPA: hypothetical protein VF189_02755 [Patescibacteria group bacterium]
MLKKYILLLKNPKILLPFLPIIFLLFFLFSFTYQSDLSFNQDLGMHLTLGRIIWQTHKIPETNLFSYTYPNFSLINHHWFFQLLLYLGSITIGIEGMLILKIIILLFSLFLILYMAKEKRFLLVLPISYIFLHLFRDRVDLRPEIFSYLFTAMTIFILDRYDRFNSKFIYTLPFITLIWVNTHIFFPVGIFMETIFLGDFIFRKIIKRDEKYLNEKIKTLFIIFLSSIVATLFNPNFINGALYPFTFFKNYGVIIVENQSILVRANFDTKNHDYLFFYISLLIIFTSFFVGLIKEKISFKNLGLILLGLGLACQSLKGLPFLTLIALIPIVETLGFIKNNTALKVLNILVMGLILFESYFYLSGNYYMLTYKPNTASLEAVADEKAGIDFVIKNNIPQPIFNTFGTGGYLLYRTYPKYKVFVDERPEAYPASFFKDTYFPMQKDYSVFKKEEKKYGFKSIIFNITSQGSEATNFLNSLNHDPQWKTVFLDEYLIIWVRKDMLDSLLLPSIDLSKVNPSEYNYSSVDAYTNLSTLMFNLGYFQKAKIFDEKALSIGPDNPVANYVMANILLRTGDPNNLVGNYLSKSNGVFW